MKDKVWIFYLLVIIRSKGNILFIVNNDHSIPDILNQVNEFIKNGLVCRKKHEYNLTEEGEHYFRQICCQLKKRGLYKYFIESLDNQINPISFDDIYIPRKRFKQ